MKSRFSFSTFFLLTYAFVLFYNFDHFYAIIRIDKFKLQEIYDAGLCSKNDYENYKDEVLFNQNGKSLIAPAKEFLTLEEAGFVEIESNDGGILVTSKQLDCMYSFAKAKSIMRALAIFSAPIAMVFLFIFFKKKSVRA